MGMQWGGGGKIGCNPEPGEGVNKENGGSTKKGQPDWLLPEAT